MVKELPAEKSQYAIRRMENLPSNQCSQKQQLEQDRMTDVVLLLETMFVREESTVKLILGCLYDVGSLNLIDQRLRARWLNHLAKWMAQHSRSVFKLIALQWFKRNCPKLITNWLYTQVKFEPHKVVKVVDAAKAVDTQTAVEAAAASISDLEIYRHEVRTLNSRIKLLTTLLIGVTVTLGGGLAWSLWRGQMQTSQVQPSIQLADRVQPCTDPLQPCR